MSKYDFKIDGIDQNNTHGKILSHIKPESEVLECGCATGYMTKYMKEKMDCTVDVIEIDESALTQAEQYARDSYLGSLEEPFWYQNFHDKQYDYVLFADVLEHLRNPMTALKNASGLLKPSGKIIVSIPNICHNDIILRMINDCFTYTNLGLLDCTHVHFWGLRDFIMNVEQIGLHAEECNCILKETGHTEQAMPLDNIDEELLKYLKNRDFGEVYQYVFICSKKEEQCIPA